MSALATVFAAVAVTVFFCAPVRAQSARELLQSCEMLERAMHVEGRTVYIPPGPEINQCWGFIEAVQQYATLADQDGKTLLDACLNPDITTTDILQVFVKYALAHPDKANLKAAAAAYNALR